MNYNAKYLTQNIASLALRPAHHPTSLVTRLFEKHITERISEISIFEHTNPVISSKQNFDDLLIDNCHPSRSAKDTYYINNELLYRTHLTGNESEFLSLGIASFLLSGVVLRRDEIDSTHYPLFHQIEGVHRVSDVGISSQDSARSELVDAAPIQPLHSNVDLVKSACHHLMDTLEYVLKSILGKDLVYRWAPCTFPFTYPSFEMEIHHDDKWVEILGCGILRQEFIKKFARNDGIYWAFGLGAERLAMKLFDIPDIRILWNSDPRLCEQFADYTPGAKLRYKPISNQPPSYRDISLWINQEFNDNDFFDAIRTVNDSIVESVKEIDRYVDTANDRVSKTFRIVFRSHSRPLTKEEVDSVFKEIRGLCGRSYAAILR